jgi:hypothetical protein
VARRAYSSPLDSRTAAPSGPISAAIVATSRENVSTEPARPEEPRTAVTTGSLPGARPMPRSIRPGAAASSRANCSATTSGGWFGSITPPEPSRIRRVTPASSAISTGGLVEATAGMLWCSATQYRW